jgi:hypothetical protein
MLDAGTISQTTAPQVKLLILPQQAMALLVVVNYLRQNKSRCGLRYTDVQYLSLTHHRFSYPQLKLKGSTPS